MFLSKKLPFILLIVGITVAVSMLFVTRKNDGDTPKVRTTNKNFEVVTNDPNSNGDTETIEVVLTDLSIPWEIAFLPNNALLITQRAGTLLYVTPDESKQILVAGVHHQGEGGLLGLAVDPNYPDNHYIYLYATTQVNVEIQNAVHRYTFDEDTAELTNRQEIIGQIPGASNHDGGRIAFGPDGYLYITTGDAQQPNSAQDRDSLAGKILRITTSGEAAPQNPYGSVVYSYGHRNPQGIDWDAQGRLWSSEHGRSVPLSGYDEINLIIAGGNYGWPEIQGNEVKSGMITPVLQSGSQTTWAPGDLVIANNHVIFSGLKGESIYTARIQDETLTNFRQELTGAFGRIRSLTVDPTNTWLYFTTSNRDGRGEPKQNDDKVVRIKLEALLDE